MSWLFKFLSFFIAERLKSQAVSRAKVMGVKTYLKVLQQSRYFLVLLLVIFLALQLTILAGVGALVTGFMLWDYDFHSKMIILFSIFAVLFLGPLGLISWLLSERFWYKASGAQKMVEDLGADF
jgi:ABC-type sulfate transport system permease component